jgi:hypothetical protein
MRYPRSSWGISNKGTKPAPSDYLNPSDGARHLHDSHLLKLRACERRAARTNGTRRGCANCHDSGRAGAAITHLRLGVVFFML